MVEGVVVSSALYRAPTWFEQRSCRSKVRFGSRWEARAAARDLVRRSGGTIKPYHCGFCDGWHAGHPMTKARSAALRAAASCSATSASAPTRATWRPTW